MEEGKRDDRGYSGEVDFRDRGPGGPEAGEQSPSSAGTALIQRSWTLRTSAADRSSEGGPGSCFWIQRGLGESTLKKWIVSPHSLIFRARQQNHTFFP